MESRAGTLTNPGRFSKVQTCKYPSWPNLHLALRALLALFVTFITEYNKSLPANFAVTTATTTGLRETSLRRLLEGLQHCCAAAEATSTVTWIPPVAWKSIEVIGPELSFRRPTAGLFVALHLEHMIFWIKQALRFLVRLNNGLCVSQAAGDQTPPQVRTAISKCRDAAERQAGAIARSWLPFDSAN